MTQSTLEVAVERRGRSLGNTDFHLRAAVDDKMPGFAGHAAVFNSRTAIGNPLTWGFYEEVAEGAFSKTLDEGDSRFLVDHDTAMIVARVSAGDLRLEQDDIGLAVDADFDVELSYVRDLVRNLDKRRITGMSFGFQAMKEDWQTEQMETVDGQTVDVEVRILQELRLFEVSAVTFPAYEETDAALRALSHRANQDPFGRRAHLLGTEVREPGESTRDKARTTEPAAATPIDLTARMKALAALTGLRA